jgi:branched-chain amino acid aminotransferase
MPHRLDTEVDCSRPSSRLPAWAYLDGRIVPYREASVGLLTHALHYGTALFAGLRGHWNEEESQLFVFRPRDHFRRFLDSGRLLRMELAASVDDLTRGVLELLRAEGYRQDCYIRPLAFYADESIGVRLHGLTARVGIVAIPFGSYLGKDQGAHVMVSSWTRVSDNVIPARGKIAGSYVNSALARTDAVLAGFDEALLLNQHGHVCEGSVENVFVVRNGVAVTPPVSDDILEGITRATVIHLLEDELGYRVVERPVDRTEVYLADEVFFSGTGAQIVPVIRVDHRAIGTGAVGPACTALRGVYEDIARGRNARYRAWCCPVYVESRAGAAAAASAAG